MTQLRRRALGYNRGPNDRAEPTDALAENLVLMPSRDRRQGSRRLGCGRANEMFGSGKAQRFNDASVTVRKERSCLKTWKGVSERIKKRSPSI
jgi:hypothetical protein